MANSPNLIFPHGGYRRLITYRLGCLIYDATEAFCSRYLDPKDRTYDQMIQAARSGVANIVEGSEAAATSKKTELKLTNVAKASQEELLFDYQAFLRQHHLPEWSTGDDRIQIVRSHRPETLDQLRLLMASLVGSEPDPKQKDKRKLEVAANVMICLIHQETYLLNGQIDRLARDFTENGSFTERLYHFRKKAREKDR